MILVSAIVGAGSDSFGWAEGVALVVAVASAVSAWRVAQTASTPVSGAQKE